MRPENGIWASSLLFVLLSYTGGGELVFVVYVMDITLTLRCLTISNNTMRCLVIPTI